MNKKTTGVIVLLILIAITSLLPACQEASPGFEVLSLDITPLKVTTGEKTTITAEIRNNDTKVNAYNVPLMVNGVADARKSVTLSSRATESITFVLTRSQAGTYRISVGNKGATLVVEKPLPPNFRLSDLEINPPCARTGEKIVITAKITNTGGTRGSYTAELKIDGVTNQAEKLIISAGTDYMLVFKVSRDLPGTYTVTLGDLTGQFGVCEPATPGFNNNPPNVPPVPDLCRYGR